MNHQTARSDDMVLNMANSHAGLQSVQMVWCAGESSRQRESIAGMSSVMIRSPFESLIQRCPLTSEVLI
jgi:hypothetical protein